MDHAHDGYHYIASPYTDPDPMVRQRRYEKALDFTGWLAVTYRLWGFSPIVHSHNMELQGNPKFTHDFWMEWGKAMLVPARAMIVFQIKGWEDSQGVQMEMDWAKELGMPVYMSQIIWDHVYDHAV